MDWPLMWWLSQNPWILIFFTQHTNWDKNVPRKKLAKQLWIKHKSIKANSFPSLQTISRFKSLTILNLISSTEVDSKRSESDCVLLSISEKLYYLHCQNALAFWLGWKKIWHMRNNCLLTKEAISYLSQKMRT